VPRRRYRTRLLGVASLDEEPAEELARWLGDRRGEPVRFEKVEPGDARILPGREQRELDALPSALDPGD
jgi:hypothetical protein